MVRTGVQNWTQTGMDRGSNLKRYWSGQGFNFEKKNTGQDKGSNWRKKITGQDKGSNWLELFYVYFRLNSASLISWYRELYTNKKKDVYLIQNIFTSQRKWLMKRFLRATDSAVSLNFAICFYFGFNFFLTLFFHSRATLTSFPPFPLIFFKSQK